MGRPPDDPACIACAPLQWGLMQRRADGAAGIINTWNRAGCSNVPPERKDVKGLMLALASMSTRVPRGTHI